MCRRGRSNQQAATAEQPLSTGRQCGDWHNEARVGFLRQDHDKVYPMLWWQSEIIPRCQLRGLAPAFRSKQFVSRTVQAQLLMHFLMDIDNVSYNLGAAGNFDLHSAKQCRASFWSNIALGLLIWLTSCSVDECYSKITRLRVCPPALSINRRTFPQQNGVWIHRYYLDWYQTPTWKCPMNAFGKG